MQCTMATALKACCCVSAITSLVCATRSTDHTGSIALPPHPVSPASVRCFHSSLAPLQSARIVGNGKAGTQGQINVVGDQLHATDR